MGPILLIVCGLPYAGKSRLSSDLVNALPNAVHIDIDDINAERGLGLDGEAVPMTEWSITYQVAYDRIDLALAGGEVVVFDAGNHSRAQRDVLRMRARSAGAQSGVIFVNMSVEDSRSRWLADDTDTMTEAEFDRIVDRFDPPQAAERVLIYLPGMSVSDLVSGVEQLFEQ